MSQSFVPFETFREDAYASFIVNTCPDFFLAAIRSEEEWNTIVHPAPVMGQQQPFGPPASLYEHHIILLIRHVAPAVAHASTFDVKWVICESPATEEKHLTVIYQYTRPSPATTAWFSGHVGIIIPRDNYIDATFIENGDVGMIPVF